MEGRADKGIILTRFWLRPDQPLEIQGTAPNSAAAADLQAYLTKSPLVKRVSLDSVNRIQQLQPGSPTLRRLRQKEEKKEEASKPKEERVTFVMTVHLWNEQAPKSRRLVAGGAP